MSELKLFSGILPGKIHKPFVFYPHIPMRWLLLDEVLEICPKEFSLTRSHVPSAPFSPEVLMLEMMAQTGGLLFGAMTDFRDDIVFGKVELASFKGPFEPSRPLEIRVSAEDLCQEEAAWFQGRISSEGELLAEARFFLVNAGRLVPGIEQSLTFPKAFLEHFQVRRRIRALPKAGEQL